MITSGKILLHCLISLVWVAIAGLMLVPTIGWRNFIGAIFLLSGIAEGTAWNFVSRRDRGQF